MKSALWTIAVLLTVWLGLAAARAQEASTPAAAPAGEAVAAAGADAEEQVPTQKQTVLELLALGGPVMYPLYLCSIVMVAFGLERGIGLRRKKILPPDVIELVRASTAGPSVSAEQLARDIERHPSPLTRVLKAGLRKAGRTAPEMEKAIEDAGAKESDAMRRNCRILAIVASIAPLLGLLGTITGMIQAFMTVAAQEEALGRTELLAAGIYQALVTTAVGLCIAIPTLILHHIYVEKVHGMVSEMDDIAADLVDHVSV